MRPKATTKDLYAALGATVAGAVFLFLALSAKWNPSEMGPGTEGTLGAGVMGTVLALLGRIEYRHTMLLTLPVIAIEYLTTAFVGGPAAGVIGLQLIIVGFIGLAIGLREPRANRASDHEVKASPDHEAAEQRG